MKINFKKSLSKHYILVSLLFPLTFIQATVYENAEDGKITGWYIYDKWPKGVKIENIQDKNAGRVIQITGTISNGASLGGWKDTNPILQWKMKADKWNVFYVVIMTTKGFRYLSYTPRKSDKGRHITQQDDKIRLGLGQAMMDGTWHTFTRNIQADLKKYEPDNTLRYIQGIKVRGAGSYDDIQTLTSNRKKTIVLNQLKAFPTAEGAGAIASGGRGGDVIYVTNRKASGAGSLKKALITKGKRTIVFAIGGRFNIDDGILLGNQKTTKNQYTQGYFTLAGQTANDKGGVHLAHSEDEENRLHRLHYLSINNQENMILRYFDSRYNWQWFIKRGEEIPTLSFTHVNDLIIDHVSSGWSSYGLIILSGNTRKNEHTLGNITVQRSLMHENVMNPLSNKNNTPHYEHNHNIGMLLGKDPINWIKDKQTGKYYFHNTMSTQQWNDIGEFSILKNAFISLSHRFPNTSGGTNGKFRMINNYSYGFKGDGTGERLGRIAGTSQNDFINNVYQRNQISQINFTTRNLFGYLDKESPNANKTMANLYAKGNLFLDHDASIHTVTDEINSNPYMMFHDRRGGSNRHNRGLNLTKDNAHLRYSPIPSSDYPISIIPSHLVKEDILNNVGGNVRFKADGSTYIDDTIDKKYIVEAKINGGLTCYTEVLGDGCLGDTLQFKNLQDSAHYNARTDEEVNPKILDQDSDGMPDAWESKHHLSPTVKSNNHITRNWDYFDDYRIINNAGYTDLEIYLAALAGDFHMLAKKNHK